MLEQIHFLLTYRCIFECDHCFVYSGPGAPDTTFTLGQIEAVLADARQIGMVDTVYFEGGEAFLAYPLLLASIRLARQMGFEVGLVTNAFFATDDENARLWLEPLVPLGICDLSISDDAFHSGSAEGINAARRGIRAARELGLPVGTITIEEPTVSAGPGQEATPGAPVVGGGVMFRGRAADRLVTADLPRQPAAAFTRCPYEDFVDPQRVHVDPQGYVHLCQGISLGNLWEQPLSALLAGYAPAEHPIAGPLLAGGPAALAEAYGVVPDPAGHVDVCHLCFEVRRALRERFPDVLAPANVYGV
ncbi:MAG: radical SAM protein [Anaerolineae bacterium]|nr:radical SAM protein [Anaerolineae bacterium]